MKAFIVLLAVVVGAAVAFPQDAVVAGEEPDVLIRAPSTYQNCDCQCDYYSWTSNGKILGNCLRYISLYSTTFVIKIVLEGLFNFKL